MGIGYNPKIVTDGLMFVVDVANTKSWNGTNSFNIINNNQNYHYGTPVYTSQYSGGLDCNASSFFALNETHNTNYITVICAFSKNSEIGTEDILYNKENSWEAKTDGGNFQLAWYASNQAWFWFDTGYNVVINQPVVTAVVYNGNDVKTYINGSLYHTRDYPDGGTQVQNSSYPKFNSRNATQGSIQGAGDHTCYHFSAYNRALSTAEIQQNFNALRGRFGI